MHVSTNCSFPSEVADKMHVTYRVKGGGTGRVLFTRDAGGFVSRLVSVRSNGGEVG